jgi:hypothetical protein
MTRRGAPPARHQEIGYALLMKNVAIVLSGILVGLVAGTILVPRVRAETPRPVGAVRWQQFCEGASSISEASAMAAARGAEGYELIGFFGGALCFKRPVPEAQRHGPPPSSGPAGPVAPRPSESAPPGSPDGI